MFENLNLYGRVETGGTLLIVFIICALLDGETIKYGNFSLEIGSVDLTTPIIAFLSV